MYFVWWYFAQSSFRSLSASAFIGYHFYLSLFYGMFFTVQFYTSVAWYPLYMHDFCTIFPLHSLFCVYCVKHLNNLFIFSEYSLCYDVCFVYLLPVQYGFLSLCYIDYMCLYFQLLAA